MGWDFDIIEGDYDKRSPRETEALIDGRPFRADVLYAVVLYTVTAERMTGSKRRPGRPIFAVRVGLMMR